MMPWTGSQARLKARTIPPAIPTTSIITGYRRSEDNTTELYQHQEAGNRLLQRDENRAVIVSPRSRCALRIQRCWADSGGYYEADTLVAEYIYNAEGQRTRKILYDAEGTATQTIIYHWSKQTLVEETTATVRTDKGLHSGNWQYASSTGRCTQNNRRRYHRAGVIPVRRPSTNPKTGNCS